MNCPVCGNEMERGKVATAYSRGLFFLLPDGDIDRFWLTRNAVERQGGVVLDGPYQSNFPNETEIAACICRTCRKILMEY